MASRVNTKFVLILAVSLVALMGVTAFIAYQALQKSADDLVKLGDQAAAANEWDKAVGFYSKAVNKDQRNSVWIERWISAMQKTRPATRTAYQDSYLGQYSGAIRAALDADRTDAKVYDRYLNERLKLTRLSGGGLQSWEGYQRIVDDAMKLFQGKEDARKQLTRYRAFARAGVIQATPDPKEEVVRAALADADAALSVNPKDWQTALIASELELSLAEIGRRNNNNELREQMLAASKARMASYIKDHAPAPEMRFRELIVTLSEAARQYRESTRADKEAFPGPALLQEREQVVKAIVEDIRAQKPEQVDPEWVVNLASIALETFPSGDKADPNWDGEKIAAEVIEKARQGSPSEAPALDLIEGGLLMTRNKFEEAEKLFQRVIDAPDQPLSLSGFRLIAELRGRALEMMGEVAYTRWRQSKPEDRAALRSRFEEIRNDLAKRVGEGENVVLSMDARLLMMKSDLSGARTAATRFNDQDGRRSVKMLMFEAELSAQTGNVGRAKQIYNEILVLSPTNLEAILRLADLEVSQSNLPEVTRLLQMAATIDPNNKQIAELRNRAQELQIGGNDPVLKAIREAQAKAEGIEGDVPGAIKILEDALKQRPADPVLSLAAAQLYLRQNDRVSARRIITESLAVHTTDQRLVSASRQLENDDPNAARKQAIEGAQVPEFQKALARHELLLNEKKPEEAAAELAKAKELAPEDPMVIEALFTDAIRRNDGAEIARLAEIAEKRNLDQLDGALFRARREIAERRLDEASKTLRDALAKDRFNVLAWRLLGLVQLQQRDFAGAAAALQKAVEINPNDLPSTKALIRALVSSGRSADALKLARGIEKRAGSDSEFAELMLLLESDAPGGDRARAIDIRTTLAERNPEDTNNKGQLAAMLINERRFEDARKLVDDLKGRRPNDLEVVQLEAGLEAVQGNFDRTMKVFEEYIATLPEDKRTAAPFVNASLLIARFGKIDEARKLLEDARKYQDPKTMSADRQIGDLMFNQARFAEAAEAYQRCLDAKIDDPDNALVKRYVESLIRSSKYKEADERLAMLGNQVQQDPTLLLLAAESASEQGDKAKARTIYDDGVRLFPKNAIIFLKRADLNRPDPSMTRDVEADYEEVLRIDPSRIEARVRLANLYRELGRIDASIDQFKKAVDQAPYEDQLRAAYIDVLLQRGRQDEAAASIDDLVKLQPGNMPMLVRGSMMMSRIGRFDKAADYLAQIWRVQKSPEIATLFGTALLAKDPPDLATANEVLVAPESKTEIVVPLRMLRAKWHRIQRRMKEATDEVVATYRITPQEDREQTLQFLSGLEEVYSKPEERIAALARLEELKPFTEWMALQTSLLRMRAGGDDTKIADVLKGVAASAKDPVLRASVFDMLGGQSYNAQRWDEALSYFRQGLEIQPENAGLNNNIAFTLTTKLSKPDEAMPFAQKAVRLAPNNSAFLDTLAAIHIAKKEYDQASEYLAQAISIASSDAERAPVFLHLARVRMEQGNRADARRLMLQATEIFNASPELAKPYETDLKELRKRIDGIG